MQRVLGEVPNVSKVYWDWRNQVGWVRFQPGRTASARHLQDAIAKGTMFSAGEVTFFDDLKDLPDEVR